MQPTVRLGRVAGIPLAAHWSALVLPILIADMLATVVLPRTVKGAGTTAYWVAGVAVAVAFLLSLCAHELAHALIARRRGLQVRGITLWMLGGMTTLDGDTQTPRADLDIAIAGPLTSLGCAAACGVAALSLDAVHAPRVAVAGAVWLAVTNAILGVFNLLPGAPLDGGRVLSAVVWRRTGDRQRGRATAARAGRATGTAMMALGGLDVVMTGDLVGGLWLAAIGWFLVGAATTEAGVAQAKQAFAGVDVASVMDVHVTTLPAYQDCAVAARRAVAADADVCPVVTFEGELVGVVDVDELVRAARMPTSRTVGTVTHAVSDRAVTTADAGFLAALEHAGGHLPLVVVDHGDVVGVVTPAALNHALRRQLVDAGTGS